MCVTVLRFWVAVSTVRTRVFRRISRLHWRCAEPCARITYAQQLAAVGNMNAFFILVNGVAGYQVRILPVSLAGGAACTEQQLPEGATNWLSVAVRFMPRSHIECQPGAPQGDTPEYLFSYAVIPTAGARSIASAHDVKVSLDGIVPASLCEYWLVRKEYPVVANIHRTTGLSMATSSTRAPQAAAAHRQIVLDRCGWGGFSRCRLVGQDVGRQTLVCLTDRSDGTLWINGLIRFSRRHLTRLS
jgi:hypothetical protein